MYVDHLNIVNQSQQSFKRMEKKWVHALTIHVEAVQLLDTVTRCNIKCNVQSNNDNKKALQFAVVPAIVVCPVHGQLFKMNIKVKC